MKIVPIFVSENAAEGLWAIRVLSEPENEFTRFFENVHDYSWLKAFFQEHYEDLVHGFFCQTSIYKAIRKTQQDAQEMIATLQYYGNHYRSGLHRNLQMIFKPLNNLEYTICLHQKSKARTRNGWIRIYALRIASNCYVVTGGAIKLTHHMRREHLQRELFRLDKAKQFLRANGINYPEDLNSFYYE